jgi:hypothetical protein
MAFTSLLTPEVATAIQRDRLAGAARARSTHPLHPVSLAGASKNPGRERSTPMSTLATLAFAVLRHPRAVTAAVAALALAAGAALGADPASAGWSAIGGFR